MKTRCSLSFRFHSRIIILLVAAISFVLSTSASVTPIAWWRLGENDPGAANGATASATTNLLGGLMNLVGGPVYTTNISGAASSGVGSVLALNFSGGNYGTNAVVSTLTDNFGIELWANAAVTNALACIAYNGNSSTSGWGLILEHGQYHGLFGGVIDLVGAKAVTGVWTHVALVRASGTATLYINGVSNAATAYTPNVPSGRFAVAVEPITLAAQYFAGALDEVRVFTFAPGSFSTNDLLLVPHIVTTANSSSQGSLRYAVSNAPAGATITFAPNLSGQTILLTSGQIVLSQNVTIDGSGLASAIQLNGNGSNRIFYVNSGVTAALNSLIITNGQATNDLGGGIYNSGGALTVNNCTLANNSSSQGGGIYQFYGTLTVNNCTLANNSCSAYGGGILQNSGTITVNNCTLDNNSTSHGGGGICTLSGTLNLTNSIVSLNSGGDIFGFITSGSSNLVGVANINLAQLGNYGGPTLTMPPLFGSPAIDAGDDSVTNFLATDQRGYPRLSGAHVDIGAVEAQWAPANLPPLLRNSAWTAPGGARCFQCTFSSVTNADFTVLATTNLALPLADWIMLAPAIQCSPGQYQFTDPGATNYPQRFYQVVSP